MKECCMQPEQSFVAMNSSDMQIITFIAMFMPSAVADISVTVLCAANQPFYYLVFPRRRYVLASSVLESQISYHIQHFVMPI